ncbi:MAG: prolipoprotein diacylglyceryl transferase [Lentimicrobiaceae bacterium]|nr:prolipoprotein diacylglyceryl transferase [Lentimicrobiaceae bacterium]
MLNYIIWNVNPVAFSLFGLEVRWYGVLFAISFLSGWWLLSRMLKLEGRKPEMADVLLWYVAIAVIVGARLGHCLFYEPQWYLSHPLDILKIRDGGLASHGAAIAILIALWLVSKKYKTSIWYWLDRVVIPIALSGFFIRMGNLMNSEIYGHVTALPWGFVFVREAETLPKHPTQIYEALCYLLLFAALLWQFWKKKGQIRNGQLFSWFLIGCFGSRFLIEFLKEVQVGWENGIILDMGQILSIPFVLAGILLLLASRKGLLDKKA